ncbi:tryptophan synthase subunit alpha [Pedobacter flavus]|uniref:Tryptophan synthase alpha chain n=1 Tax=Pedobacter flavus TaxID=3113906 RepID=A0ABU7H259_9SPHI|nr:tryptophan synthase subunit alpha [Pedobacter sp. VNH31]MEE1885402.1 tryptophan synthase subunit alpha [Pedobacter sp. VNH31]
MENRIRRTLANKSEKLISIYFTAGYPNLNDTIGIAENLQNAGADLIEIGIPFSDPSADGPVIQAANKVALDNGMSLKLLFTQLKDLRKRVDIPVLLMGYLNPVMQFGIEEFCKSCAEVGIDGCILPDLPLAEYKNEYESYFKHYNLEIIWLITPQTTEERIRAYDENSNSFLYALSSSSTTGNTADSFSEDSINYFNKLKMLNLKNPFFIGFGISNKNTLKQAFDYAKGAIIGTAFIKSLNNANGLNKTDEFINLLKK